MCLLQLQTLEQQLQPQRCSPPAASNANGDRARALRRGEAVDEQLLRRPVAPLPVRFVDDGHAHGLFRVCAARREGAVPLLFDGLTCTDENFVQKAMLRARGRVGIAGRHARRLDSRTTGSCPAKTRHDFGSGAGFTSTPEYPWSQYYNMYSFVPKNARGGHGGVPGSRRRRGPSQGIHGRPRRPDHRFQTAGRLAERVGVLADLQPDEGALWGQKAFEGYLGSVDAGLEHDACELVKKGPRPDAILVSQGGTTISRG